MAGVTKSIYLDPEDWAVLEKQREIEDRSISNLIRRAIVQTYGKSESSSITEYRARKSEQTTA